MRQFNRPPLLTAVMFGALGIMLAGCAGVSLFPHSEQAPPAAAPMPSLPGAFPAHDLVGRWGLAAYHQEADRDRTIQAAAHECNLPYVIAPGPSGGVMMHLADEVKPSDLQVKGGPGGKTYIGPPGPPGAMQDREVVRFDGRVLILHWVDPEVQGRYGNMVYVRCPPKGAKSVAPVRHKAKRKHKAQPKRKAKPKAQEP